MRRWLSACLASIAVTTHSVAAMEEIVVTARRESQPRREVAGSLSIVEAEDLRAGRAGLHLDETLSRVPGVFFQNSGNFAQDDRLQIRGFGTRAAFGVREVRVLVDGLPETLPDGQTQLDELNLDAIDRIEVLRGTAAALYGNAAGGVLQLFTGMPPESPAATARYTGGAFGLRRFSIRGGMSGERAGAFVHASHFRIDGYRQHAAAETTTVGAKIPVSLLDDLTLTTLIDAVDAPQADDAGALTRAETKADPEAANARNVQFDAGEALQQGRIGWMASYAPAGFRVDGYTYLLYRDFENRLAFENGGWVTFNRFSPGGGLRVTDVFEIFGRKNSISVGTDVQYQDDNRRRFDNVRGDRGKLVLDQRERVTAIGPYLLDVLRVTDEIEASAALRYDRVAYDVDVDYDAAGGDNSGTTSFDAWSPAASLRYSPRAWLALFGNVGTAFQVPTTTELAVPNQSGLAGDLEPQRSVAGEIGVRILHAPKVSGGVTAFYIDLDDELIAFEVEPGRSDFRNAGRSRRYGVEADWQAWLTPRLRWTGAVTWMDARYRDYRISGDPAGNFDGNREPGIPPWQLFLEMMYRHPSGVFTAVDAFVVDKYFVNDANSAKSTPYELFNIRVGWEGQYGHWTLSPFVALNNITNAQYDGTVRLNALGGRYYEPAPRFHVFAGVSAGWE